MKFNWAIVAMLVGCGESNPPGARDIETDCGLLGQSAYRQGSLRSCEHSLDMALVGPGFFVLSDESVLRFTRQGMFSLDYEGFLVCDGYRVQGVKEGATSPSDLNFLTEVLAPSPTSQIEIVANLEPSTAGYSEFVSLVTIYDVSGVAYLVEVKWTHSGQQHWTMHAFVDGESVVDGIAGVPVEIASSELEFDEAGSFKSHTATGGFTPPGKGKHQELTFLFSVSQFASPSFTNHVNQNGYAGGFLGNVQADNQGTIEGVFTNGINRRLAQVSVATFSRPEALRRLPNNLLLSTSESGPALVGLAGESGRGDVVTGALERLPEVFCAQ